MPWAWDARIEDNPVGTRGLSDFCEAVTLVDPTAKRPQQAGRHERSVKKQRQINVQGNGQDNDHGYATALLQTGCIVLYSLMTYGTPTPRDGKENMAPNMNSPAASEQTKQPHSVLKPTVLGMASHANTPHTNTPAAVELARYALCIPMMLCDVYTHYEQMCVTQNC